MPVVDDLCLGGRENHKTDVRCTAGVASLCFAVMHDRVADRPMALLYEAAIAPAPGYAKSSGNRDGFSGRIDTASESAVLGEDLSTNVLRQITGEPTEYRRDHGAPTD